MFVIAIAIVHLRVRNILRQYTSGNIIYEIDSIEAAQLAIQAAIRSSKEVTQVAKLIRILSGSTA